MLVSAPIRPRSSWPRPAKRLVRRVRGPDQPAGPPVARPGAGPLDHYAILMENNDRVPRRLCGAGERAGLLLHCVNSHLTAEESPTSSTTASEGADHLGGRAGGGPRGGCALPRVTLGLIVDGTGPTARSSTTDGDRRLPGDADRRRMARHGDALLVGHDRPAQGHPAPRSPTSARRARSPLFSFLTHCWRYRRGHDLPVPRAAVPLGAAGSRSASRSASAAPHHHGALRSRAVPRAVERYRVTHSQLVPTMFSRMLKLPEEVEHGTTCRRSRSRPRRRAVPGAGQGADDRVVGTDPLEYYAATEAHRLHVCDSEEWLAHTGTVGKVVLGELHILDDDVQRVPAGDAGHDLVRAGGRRSSTTTTPRRRPSRPRPTARWHGRRRRLRRRRRLPVPHRPQDVHDHLRRREHLPAGDREPPDHPPQGRRRRRLRRAQRRPRRGSQGRRPARCPASSPDPSSPPSSSSSAGAPRPAQVPALRSTSTTELPRLPTGKLYKKALRDRYWAKSRSNIV